MAAAARYLSTTFTPRPRRYLLQHRPGCGRRLRSRMLRPDVSEWRSEVDHTERTGLVTTGLFSLVRNPFFTAMALARFGLTLILPNVVALVGFISPALS